MNGIRSGMTFSSTVLKVEALAEAIESEFGSSVHPIDIGAMLAHEHWPHVTLSANGDDYVVTFAYEDGRQSSRITNNQIGEE